MTRHEAIKEVLITGFKKRFRRDMAITNAKIIKAMHEADLHKRLEIEEITEGMIRDAINDIRSDNPFGEFYLVSNGKQGYWITNDVNEIEKWFDSYYGRIQNMIPVIREAKKYVGHKKSEQAGTTLFDLEQLNAMQPKVLNNNFIH